MKTPEVSVLMPAKNAEQSIGRAVSSILNGTFRDLELIVVDDGSTDSTAKIISAWSDVDPRVRFFRQKHMGLVAALNHGLSYARARLIARMDADDVSHPDRLCFQIEHLRNNPETDVCGCHVVLCHEGSCAGDMKRYIDWQNGLLEHGEMYRDRFVDSVLTHATAVIRRKALDAVGGWPDPDWAEDVELWFRLFEMGAVFSKVERELYTWTIHHKSASWNDVRYRKSRMDDARFYHLMKSFLNPGEPVELWGIGRSLQRWDDVFRRGGASVANVRNIVPGSGIQDLIPRSSGTKAVAFFSSDRVRRLIREAAAEQGWREGLDLILSA